jgi:enamine deaminase RidA (YjgF/YER057c/UK114 family)
MQDVIKVNAYLTDPTRFSDYNEVYREFFNESPPVRTTVQTGLIKILVEIDCIAVLPRTEDRARETRETMRKEEGIR